MRMVSMACVLCVACGAPRRGGDDFGGGTADGPRGATGDGGDGCSEDAKLVYVIDQFNARLSRFDPATRSFTDLGSLSCPTMAGATPFSMSVARNAHAWVLYNSGELFDVTIEGLACTKMPWTSPNNLKVFGMGFSSDQPGGDAETLFINGGLTQTQPSFTLASVNPTDMTTTVLGTEPALAEMTGTGNAELWGFFPETTTARVVKFDKTNGAVAMAFDEPSLAGTMTGYAFAHWGGDYWVFLIKNSEASTTVYQVDGTTGTITSTTPTSGRVIVGAGVSTCAPVVIE
jgi:hypothetical protein